MYNYILHVSVLCSICLIVLELSISRSILFSPLLFLHALKRMERVALRSSSTQAKIIGTLLSISGALIAVLYKGPTLLSSTPSNKLQHSWGTSQTNWLIGGFLFFFHYLMVSTWYIVQVFFIYFQDISPKPAAENYQKSKISKS